MTDLAGLNLKEPEQIDWDNYNPGSKYVAPPPAKGADGKYLTYFGQIPQTVGETDTLGVTKDEGYRTFLIDPIKIVKSGTADGYQLRFSRVSTKPFAGKDGKPINANGVGNFLRAASILAKPQKNSEYEAAVKATRGRVVPLTVEWFARNKDTGEQVRGYDNFPEDPDRPGQKKSILKAGDVVLVRDKAGVVIGQQVIKSEVMFANAQLRYFQDPNKK